jgi:hypothetical protein
LHTPRVYAKLQAELDAALKPLADAKAVYPYSAVDPTKLPYLNACIVCDGTAASWRQGLISA